MGAMALSAGAWRPPSSERYGIGVTLALLAHALLIAALAIGLHWRNTPPVTLSAELWSAVPQVAAPPPSAEPAKPVPPAPKPVVPKVAPPPPPPAQRQADIALERARIEQQRLAQEAAARRQAEEEAARRKAQEDAQRLKAQQLADAKAREAKAAEEKRQQELKAARDAQQQAQQIAKAREENLKRMLAQAGAAAGTGTTPSGTAPRDAGPSASYAGRIKARIKPNIRLLTEVDGNPTTEVEVRCAADGEIIGRRIVKPSGNPIWDETVLRAIDITRVLPRDVDGRVPSTMLLVFPRQE